MRSADRGRSTGSGDFWDALDHHSMETQASKVVRHAALGQVSWLLAKQRRQILAKLAIRETGREQLEQQQCAP